MSADPRAVLTRTAAPPDLTLRYGDHRDQVVDLRLPATTGPGPLVVVIHGGFWRSRFDRTHTGPLAADLAARGHPVAQVEYRRTGTPGGGWPGTFADLAACLQLLPALVAEAVPALTAGAAAPVLLGHSAGGHLALWWAGRAGAGGPGGVAGVVALAPVAGLGTAYRMGLGDGAVAALLGGGPEEVPQRYRYAEPAPAAGVPTVLVHGAEDRVVPPTLSREWAAAARATGADATLVELPAVEHFAVIDPESAAWPVVTQVIGGLTGRRSPESTTQTD